MNEKERREEEAKNRVLRKASGANTKAAEKRQKVMMLGTGERGVKALDADSLVHNQHKQNIVWIIKTGMSLI